MKDVIIEVRAGAIMDVYCDSKDVRFVIVDWDRVTSGEGCDGAGYVQTRSAIRELPSDTKMEYRKAAGQPAA